MTVQQNVAFKAIFQELLMEPTLDIAADYSSIEARFLQLKLPRAAVDATMNSLTGSSGKWFAIMTG